MDVLLRNASALASERALFWKVDVRQRAFEEPPRALASACLPTSEPLCGDILKLYRISATTAFLSGMSEGQVSAGVRSLGRVLRGYQYLRLYPIHLQYQLSTARVGYTTSGDPEE
jgi:hypothetical protein